MKLYRSHQAHYKNYKISLTSITAFISSHRKKKCILSLFWLVPLFFYPRPFYDSLGLIFKNEKRDDVRVELSRIWKWANLRTALGLIGIFKFQHNFFFSFLSAFSNGYDQLNKLRSSGARFRLLRDKIVSLFRWCEKALGGFVNDLRNFSPNT